MLRVCSYLEQYNFVRWLPNEERFVPSLLGSATFMSSLPPKDAVWVAEELGKARQNFVRCQLPRTICWSRSSEALLAQAVHKLRSTIISFI